MTEHVQAQLGAYHDGTLKGRRLQQVEAHLSECAACQAELEKLQALSALLQESPAASGLRPPECFVAQVGLQLPRRPDQPAWSRAARAGWRLVPLGLLGAWTFVQATFVVTVGVLLALRLGLVGSAGAEMLSTLSRGFSTRTWFSFPRGALSEGIWTAVQALGGRGPLGLSNALNLFLVAIVLLYWRWLASWWAMRKHRIAVENNNLRM